MKIEQSQQSADNTQEYISNEDTGDFTSEMKEKQNQDNIFLTFFYIFMASLLFTITSVLIKALSYIDPRQLAFIRTFGIFAGALPMAIYYNKDILGQKSSRCLLLMRGLLGGLGYFLDTIAFSNLPVAEATIIICLLPAMTTVMAKIFLKEPCGLVQSFILITTICGVLFAVNVPELISKKSEFKRDYDYFGGLAAAIANVFLRATINVTLRKLKHTHFTIVTLYLGFLSTTMNACAIITVSAVNIFPTTKPHCGWDEVLLVVLSLLSWIQSITATVSMQRMDAGIVAVLRTSEIVLAIVFQVAFFREVPGIFNICGGCIVILSISLLGIRKWIMTVPEESKYRKIFKYLLF